MNPLLLKALMENLGMTTPEAQNIALGDFLTSTVNAGTFNQLPRIAAAGSTAFTGEDYNQALERAYAGRQAIRERSPLASGAGDIIGGLVNPVSTTGALPNIANVAAQTALYQTGEQGTSLQDAASAGLLGGGTAAALESIPLAGKALRKFTNWAEESGLGVKRAATKKATKQVADKELVKKGYAEFKQMLKSGAVPKEDVAKYNKIFQQSSTKAEVADKILSEEVNKLVDSQVALVKEADRQLAQKVGQTGAVATGPISFVDWQPKSFNDEISKLTGGDVGSLNPKDFPEANKFSEAYKKVIGPIQGKITRGEAVNLSDLLQAKKAANAAGLYSETAEPIARQAYTAAINDLNRSIDASVGKYAQAGILPADAAGQFSELGKKSQKLIAFKDALEFSKSGQGNLSAVSDLLRGGIGGTPIAIGLYTAGVPVVPATLGGAFLGTPTGMGITGKAVEKGLNLAEDVGGMSRPFIDSAIKTGIPLEGEAPEPNMSMPQQTGSADSLSSRLMAEFGSIPSQPSVTPSQAPQSLSERLLAEFGQAPQSVESGTSSLANGDLPSQQPSLKQDVSLSPDRRVEQPSLSAASFGSLADFYPALAMTESSLNPMARNPNSSAKGLFQFVDKTAQGVGLQDPFDPYQSLAAVQSLTQENVNRFGVQDPVELYKMHYLGAPTYEAYRNNQPLNKQWQIDAVNSLPTVTSRFQNNLAAVQQPDSPIRQQFMELFS